MNKVVNISYLLFAFMLDLILQSLFPVDFEYRRLFVVFNTGLIGLMLVLKKENFKQVLIVAFLVGLILDFVRYGYFFLYALSFSLAILIARLWSNQVNETNIELMILSITVVFLKELIQFGLLTFAGLTQMHLSTWFIYRGFLTILMHVPLSYLMIYTNRYRLKRLGQNLDERTHRENSLYRELRKPTR